MGLSDIIRNTLSTLKEQGQVLTPINYKEVFCKEAKKAGLIIEDCNELERYIARLDKTLQKELKGYHLRSVDELFSFLGGKIARLAPESSQELMHAMTILIKRMAQVAQQMHNKDLAQIASRTAEHIETVPDAAAVEKLKDAWIDFLTTYDDSFLDRLSILGKVDKEDLRGSIHTIVDSYSSEHNLHIPDNIGQLIVASLVPSIAASMNDEIAVISSQIRQDPNVLDSTGMQEDIKFAIKKRIELDKSALKDTVYQLDEIAGEVSKRLLHIIEQSESKKEELGKLKKELENLDMTDKKSLTDIHQRLLQIAQLLEDEASSLNEEVKSQQIKISSMDKKIMLLEEELTEANKESREDFLTKLFNKRALEEKLRELDASYKRYGRDFSLFFIDIDHFKKINDNYGHDAGDAVLRVFAKVLRQQSRDVDFIARFGGEEFVIVMPETTKEGAKQFANKLRLILQKNRFVYKEHRLKLTVSGGIGQRSESETIEELVKTADSYVYEAKAAGRNRILPK